MKNEILKKINDELKMEMKKNDEQIKINDERKRMAMVNRFEHKFMDTMALSIISSFVLIVLYMILVKNGVILSIASTIPTEIFPLIYVGSSLCIGTIGKKIFERKFKTKERLKSFSKANTELEKFQEEIKYEIELEKIVNKNKIIKQEIDSLNSNQSILNSLSTQYDIIDKFIFQTKDNTIKKMEDLSLLLDKQYNELNILTTKKILHERFWHIRANGQKIMDVINYGMMGGFLPLIYVGMPILASTLINPLTSISALAGITYIFSALALGIAGTTGYILKRNKIFDIVFNNLNNELGENALPTKIKNVLEEQNYINTEIENKIREISTTEIQLKQQKNILESFSNENKQKENISETLVTTKDTISKIDNINGNLFEEIESEKEEKGTQLILKK